jgi:TM2 domain-containing membrane protein YozV
MSDSIEPTAAPDSKKIPAALLAFFLGGLGVHKFYLGNTKAGVIQILSNVLCLAGSIIAFIEFIIYLTKSDADFVRIYQVEKKQWF